MNVLVLNKSFMGLGVTLCKVHIIQFEGIHYAKNSMSKINVTSNFSIHGL
jgi:hypothetical protein